MALVVVVGNPRPKSRTLAFAASLGHRIAQDLNESIVTIDLATFGPDLLDGAATTTSEAVNQVLAARLLVVASPTYKASFTGVLKLFLDQFPGGVLNGLVTVPVMTGGSLAHSLAVDVHLRPVLLELGASLPTRSLYVLESQFAETDAVIEAWWQSARATCLSLVHP